MAKVIEARHVCDGYDIRVEINKSQVVLHFLHPPTEQELDNIVFQIEYDILNEVATTKVLDSTEDKDKHKEIEDTYYVRRR